MIPLGDIDRKPSRFPLVTFVIIGLNCFVFFLEIVNGDPFVEKWALVPAKFLAGDDRITMLTAMFLHGGLLHIMGNMIFFWSFGPEIEDMMGRVRYIIFYITGGVAAFGAQLAMVPESTLPTIGASGAIASVMGAFLVTFPRDRIRTVLLIGFFAFIRFVPALVLVGFWFLLQLVSHLASLGHAEQGGVAYMAHIGGFFFGIFFGRLFEFRRAYGK